MFWITILAVVMAAALVKLGAALVMVSILSAALWLAVACLAVPLSLCMWRAWRK